MDRTYPMDDTPQTATSQPPGHLDSTESIDMPADTTESSTPAEANVVPLTSLPTQCRGTNRSGNQCGRAPIPGGAVCHYHGGAAPQVREKAAERLAQARDLALERFIEYVADDGDIADPKVLLDAIARLTDKVELLQGRATQRTEIDERQHYEQVKINLIAKLDDLAARNYRGIVREPVAGIEAEVVDVESSGDESSGEGPGS